MTIFGKPSLPDFVVIGAQKCATTSLLAYMGQHSRIRLGFKKATHYFDRHHAKSVNWYARQFPAAPSSLWGKARDWLTGESCPAYMFLPEVPQRMSTIMPQVRLIAIVRDPVKRLVSQYGHEKRKGRVDTDFAGYVEQSIGMDWPTTGTLPFVLQQAAVPRGFYADQLRHWQKFFPREQILVVSFEDLIARPGEAMERIFEFLQLSPETVDTSKVLNKGSGSKGPNIDSDLLEKLRELYLGKNRDLPEIANATFSWLE